VKVGRLGAYCRWGKRLLDVLLSGVALVLLAPVLLALAIAVRVKLGAPVLFRQRRPGFRGRPFVLLKFRSMSSQTDSEGRLLPDSERLGSFGKALRATSLDELPEFWNVLRGDMSLVGPRPLLVEYLDRYSPEQARRHECRPGLTGLAQVGGRNALTWSAKFSLDVWYVDHVSLRLDASILWRTIRSVLRREGIAAQGEATMPPFGG